MLTAWSISLVKWIPTISIIHARLCPLLMKLVPMTMNAKSVYFAIKIAPAPRYLAWPEGKIHNQSLYSVNQEDMGRTNYALMP